MKLSTVLLVVLILATSLHAQTVSTQYGPVTGHLNGAIYEFLGIPFAAPPVGTLRWRPTAAPADWTVPLLADSFPPKCPQKDLVQGEELGEIVGDEDCLYLNVWSPDTTASLPVMVFIHGGGNQGGSSSETAAGAYIYPGNHLAERGQVILVTIQYRLGPLGYLVHPGLELENAPGTAGNYGVMDQLFALQWVQENIHHFGGDPGNVTIFGESAGGVNVGNLLTTAAAAGLFHKAIIESARPGIEAYASSREKGIDYVHEFTTSGTDAEQIAFLRTVLADSLVSRLESPLQGGIVQQQWRPTVDGQLFTAMPETIFQSGDFNQVPLIVGSNADEISLSAPPVVTPGALTAFILSTIPAAHQSEAFALYPPGSTNEEARAAMIALLTDAQFTNTTRQTAQCVSLNQSEPVWRYFFTHRHNPALGALHELGSYHGMELFYVFNSWEDSPFAFGPLFTAADAYVQDAMLTYWTHFAYTGDPNDGLLPAWPVYAAETDCYLEINIPADGSLCGIRTDACNFWDAVSGYTPCESALTTGAPAEAPAFTLYPNPARDRLLIRAEEPLQHLDLTILNTTGQVVLTQRDPLEIDISGLASGLYLLRIKLADGRVRVEKFVKTD
ncbi:MAG: carboxylesterase family protein [Lewinella sp.]|nr:carboxylesterase family protein [Lewinella sp.]